MDYYRGMVVLNNPLQVIDVINLVDNYGLGVVEFDYDKLVYPEEWGYRDMNFTFRMPNGLMVEFQVITKGISDVKPHLHKYYEKWRPYGMDQIIAMGRHAEHENDMKISNDGYSKAWNLDLKSAGMGHDELNSSLITSFLSYGLVATKNSSSSSPTVISHPGVHEPSLDLVNMSRPTRSAALDPLRSANSFTSDNSIGTSKDNIIQKSDYAYLISILDLMEGG